MFSSYEQYLSEEFSPDYWSDEGISIASGLLSEFTDEDWERLAKAWREMPGVWKVRCAETIDSHSSSMAAGILVAMLYDLDRDVVIAAADSLRSMPDDAIRLTPHDIERLSALKEQVGTIDRLVLDSLLSKRR